MNFKIINVFGMKRSGLHCIINDILDYFTNYSFINDYTFSKYNKYIRNKEINKIILYEDKLFDINDTNSINIIIVRDIEENITSRIHKNKHWCRITKEYVETYSNILSESLNNTNNIKNKIIINYNKFISDNNYRKNIFIKLGYNFDLQPFNLNRIPSNGGGKSFSSRQKRSDVKISSEIIEILNENRLINLTEKYFKYKLFDRINKYI